jgi:hypothetical protein
MLPFVTETFVNEHTSSCMIDHFIDNEFLCINNNPNSDPMTSNEFTETNVLANFETKRVTKSYEINDGVIQESYFDLENMRDEDANDFISDFASSFPKGIILVVNNNLLNGKFKLLPIQLKSQLKQTIVYSGTPGNDLKAASQNAYNSATSGQAILFQGVSDNFDLLSYIY